MTKQKHKTIGLRGILALIVAATVSVVGGAILTSDSEDVQAAYPTGCVSQACREAADRASASDARAKELTSAAQTLENEVARLNAEIAALEDEITMHQAIANDLSEQIAINEQKLDIQQTALAKLIVDLHFETEPDAILILAGSNSISDLAEKQSRQSNVQSQITSSAIAIKELKEELESQKASVDALIESAELSRNMAAAKRNEQAALIAKYENDSAAYERDAMEARETMQREIAIEIARYNSGGVVGSGYNSYPWAANCPRDNVQYLTVGGYVCQCTSYAGWKTQEFWGIYISSWGNARDWGVSAARSGYVVDNTPAPHTVGYSTSGIYGHVVWVESVNANGTINLTEYNNSGSSASGLAGDFGARYNVSPGSYSYIHFDQKRW